jgi:hypothetical protein
MTEVEFRVSQGLLRAEADPSLPLRSSMTNPIGRLGGSGGVMSSRTTSKDLLELSARVAAEGVVAQLMDYPCWRDQGAAKNRLSARGADRRNSRATATNGISLAEQGPCSRTQIQTGTPCN